MSRESERIAAQIVQEFRCFGAGSNADRSNPIVHALAERPPVFALGVDVLSVVERVLQLSKQKRRAKAA